MAIPNLLTEAIADISSRLEAAGIVSFEAESEVLIADFLQVSRGELRALALTGEERDLLDLEPLVERRVSREPLQHITGKAPFRSIELKVGPGVFIPRFETELVTQIAIDYLNSLPNSHSTSAVLVNSILMWLVSITLMLESKLAKAKVSPSNMLSKCINLIPTAP